MWATQGTQVQSLAVRLPQYTHDIDQIENLDDELGRKGIARVIADEIRGDKGHRVIGIYGWWGSGKSYLVSQTIKALLEQNQAESQQIIACGFRAWRYEMQRSLAPGLIKALRNIEHQYLGHNPPIGRTQRYKEIARELLWFLEAMLEFGAAFTPQGQAIAPAVYRAFRTIDRTAYPRGREHTRAITDGDEIDEITTLMQQLVDAILDAARTAGGAPSRGKRAQLVPADKPREWRLVVFIDDLDRCSPQNMVRLLEWLKVHLLVDRCTYVLALDHVAAARAIVGHYKEYLGKDEDLAYGFRYLEKLVDNEYELELAPDVEIMALHQIYGKDTPYRHVSDAARDLSGGDFPGIASMDELLNLRSLRMPRTMLKITYKFGRALDTILSDSASVLRTQLPPNYPFWVLFMTAMYYRLDPDYLADFIQGRGTIFRLITHPNSVDPLNWGDGPLREFCQFANRLGASVGTTMQLPTSSVLSALATIIRENTLSAEEA